MDSTKCLPLIFILLLPALISGGTIWSTDSDFNASSPVYMNFTNSYNGNTTLGVNSTGILEVGNVTNTVRANYTQPASGWTYGQSSYDSSLCGLGSNNFDFRVRNGTGCYNVTENLTGTSWVALERIEDNCPPGRYYGLINITNSTLATDYANVTVVMNLPINEDNSLNTTLGIGQFRGTMSTTTKTYHIYYINTSDVENSTSVTVKNLAPDVFLFDPSGNLKAKNILGSGQSLVYQYLTGEALGIAVFDNSSTAAYSGLALFSTLNATSSGQQVLFLDFGEMSASEKNTTQLRLENEGALTLSSVSQGRELYHTDTRPGSGPETFGFRVPDFATEVRAELRWNGSSNYTVRLYKPDGTSVSNSSGSYINSNITGVEQEEYAEYSGIVGFANAGLWTVEVVNNTNATNSYVLDFKVWMDPAEWVDTNYSTKTFNSTTSPEDVELNFTVQNYTLSGQYNGSLSYTSSAGAVVRVPFGTNVTAPELFANGTFRNSTITVNENRGFNRTVNLNVTVNNTGNQELSVSHSNSSFLNHTAVPSNYVELSYVPVSSIASGESDTLEITLTIDTTKTNNTAGTYEGWIYLNDSDARPYTGFNLTLQVVLSNSLSVLITDLVTEDGDSEITSRSSDENFTVEAKVFYANGTSTGGNLTISNFGSVRLRNQNVTYWIPDSGYFDIEAHDDGLWQGGFGEYWINATFEGDTDWPGGYFSVYLSANKSATGATLSGTNSSGTLTIPGEGMWFTEHETVSNFDEVGETQYYVIKVINYGTEDATSQINLTLTGGDCDDYIILDVENATSGCGSDDGGAQFDIDIDPGDTCYFTWEVKVKDSINTDYVVDEEDCLISVKTDENRFTVLPQDYFDVYISEGSSGGSDDDDDDENEDIDITEYPSSLTITQNETDVFEITVENDGDTDENNIELTITGIPSSWYSFSPSNLDLDSGDEDEFDVTLEVPEDGEVKSYSLTFKADNGDVSDSKSSTLKVLPCEEGKESINLTYTGYMENYTRLLDRMRNMSLEGKNVTELNSTMQDIKSKLDAMLGYMEDDDYFNAAQIIDDIESLFTAAEAQAYEEAGEETVDIIQEATSYVWLVIGVVIIIIAGFLVYMFMPPPKDSHKVKKFKYAPPGKGDTLGKKIDKQIRRLKTKLSDSKKKEGFRWKKK